MRNSRYFFLQTKFFVLELFSYLLYIIFISLLEGKIFLIAGVGLIIKGILIEIRIFFKDIKNN